MGKPSNVSAVIQGSIWGRLKVLSLNGCIATCSCVCGNIVHKKRYLLASGGVKSCGCLHKERAATLNYKHGMSNSRVKGYASREYGIWQAFRDRCNNKNRKDYHRYGGRGISYCPSWESFEVFLKDMGPAPIKSTLDRVDNSGPYSKDNCRWATRKEQACNRDTALVVTINNVKILARDVAASNGIKSNTFKSRYYKQGWTLEEACGVNKHRKEAK